MRRLRLLLGAAALSLSAITPGAAAPTPGYRVVDRIAGPDGGWDHVRVDAANNRVLVARGGSVMMVDLGARAVTSGLAPGPIVHDVLPVNGGQVLVTYGGSASAVFFDGSTWARVAAAATGTGPAAAVYDAFTGLILVMNHAGGDVTLIDGKAHAAVATVPVGGALEAAATDGRGRAYINVEDRNEIAVLNVKARKVIARHPLPGCEGPTGIAYDAADRQLIVACDGSTVVLDARSGIIRARLPTGRGADGVAFDAQRRLAFVPAGQDGTLSVIELRGGGAAIAETVATEAGARTIAIDPRTGRLYLPSARFGPPSTGGGRPPIVPGSFHLLIVERR